MRNIAYVQIAVRMFVVLGMAVVPLMTVAANTSSLIDFEGLPEGAIVSSVSFGSGISGDDAGGAVSVSGFNPKIDPPSNAAMIFDAECLPGGTSADCTGGDSDLNKPSLGNVLIISEDLDSTDPDDADVVGAFFKFDFSGWGPGTVTVWSIDVLDVEDTEGGAKIELFFGGVSGTLLDTVAIPPTGDNGLATVAVGTSGVDFMRVTLNGSGAIDNIEIETEDENGEGCTPGYWKNHLDSWAATGLDPNDDFDTTFGVDLFDPDITLEEAVNAEGGDENRLARHGTAALLSAAHPDVDYGLTVAEVIALVQSGDADTLELHNELGCPLD